MDVRFLRVYGLFCGDKSDTVCVYLSVVTRKRSCPLFDFMKKREFVLIEHYFTNDEIKRSNEQGQRLFLGNEFNKVGNHNSEDYNYHYIGKLYNTIKIIERETGKNVTDKNGNGDYGLSKKHFAETICNKRPNFNDFSFSEFNKIFDVIREIIKDMQVE